MSISQFVLVLSGVLCGLIAGLLFSFTVSVVPGLRKIDAKAHIAAMQAINIAIVNPVFMLSFLGPTVLLTLVAFLYRETDAFPFLLAAAVLHIVGVNGVTILGNVPLNNRLAQLDGSRLSPTEAEEKRMEYHGTGARWMLLHHIRTLCSVVAAALVFAACLAI